VQCSHGSLFAMIFSAVAVYQTIVEIVFDTTVFSCTKEASMAASLNTMDSSEDSNIPLAFGFLLQLYQALTVLIYFVTIQMGDVKKLDNYCGLLLWYPLLCIVLLFCVHPVYYMHAWRLSSELAIIGIYHIWLIVTLQNDSHVSK